MEIFSTYTLSQWLMFFYAYSFLGWIWECCYVSVRVKKLTNRGFMHGPMLPIYGSGAMTLLVATLPVRDSIPLVFIVSIVSATILEFITGTIMEDLFKVRYWDYSKDKFNYKGQICVRASFAWGVFGVLLIFCINRPVEAVILSIPERVIQLIAFGITIVASCDFGSSFREAMDVRELMMRLAEERDRQMKRFGKRVDVMAAVYGNDLENARKEYAEKLDDFIDTGHEYFDRTKEKLSMLSENQIRKLNRFIKANPEAESKHMRISGVLTELKDFVVEKGTLVGKSFMDKVEKKEEEE